VEKVVRELVAADRRILTDPAPYVALNALSSSSVDVVIRVWVKSSDYWDVYHHTNKTIYATFNKEGINFPFPQLTVHQAKD
jgi:small conductance mechanosensitive channel